jgi:hypothetical protein
VNTEETRVELKREEFLCPLSVGAYITQGHTVNKQRSLNLRFFSMFSIESKIVHVGAEKIITLDK